MRIAIIKLGALGDVLRTTALLKPLHAQYPKPEIWWFTQASAAPLLERNPWIHKVIALETLGSQEPSKKVLFDWVLGLDEDPRACALCSQLRALERPPHDTSDARLFCGGRFGAYQDTQGKLAYTPSSRAWFDMGLLNRDPDGSLTTANRLKKANTKTYPRLLFEMLRIPPELQKEAEPCLFPDPEEERWAHAFAEAKGMDRSRYVIGLNTSAGSRWLTKQLSIEKTLAVIQAIGQRPQTTLVLLGGPEEKERNAALLERSPVPLVDTGTDNSLQRFISIVNLCDAVLTSDSLALHVACALRKKVIVFFGPTSSTEIELYDRGMAWLPSKPCECFYLSRCQRPIFCLDTLDENEILKKLDEWRCERGGR